VYRAKKFDVFASEIADYLNKTLVGEDFQISDFRSLRTGSGRKGSSAPAAGGKVLLINKEPLADLPHAGFIASETPDLDLAYVLREFFASSAANEIHATAIISPEAQLGRNVMVGPGTVIGPDVVIGDNSKILCRVVFNGPVNAGKFCVVKDGAVIGSEGWGFIKDEEGVPFHPPQLGRIIISDMVWIGSNSTIERAMIDDTVIGANVKIDDLVHIGGGSSIGPGSELTAGVVVASHVVIGANVRIAPNAAIRENIRIGDGAVVGQGAVVIRDVP
jgi:UDP-3-O-[3-hydroxymyristoyl] glucosamine N-acyltransferase